MGPSNSLFPRTIEGLGLLLGMIIGAGMFALPYSISKVGLFWGSVIFLVVLVLSILLHFLYAAIIYTTPGKHRVLGYMKAYLGPRASFIMAIFTFLGYYGAMLAYGILGGIFLKTLFGLEFLDALDRDRVIAVNLKLFSHFSEILD